MEQAKKYIGIILAAGMGTRMKSSLPKVLHRLCGLSLIERSVVLARQLPLQRKIVVLPSNNELIRSKLPQDFEIAVQENPLGTADAVMSVRPLLENFKGDVVIICADAPLMTFETLKKFIEKHEEGHYYGSILTGKLSNPAGYGRIVRKGSNEVAKIVEDAQATLYEKAVEEINSGTYCFSWPALDAALSKIQIHPEKKEFYLTDVIEVLVSDKKAVGAYCVEDAKEILGINSRHQLAEAEKILRMKILDRWMENGVTIVDPVSTFIDETVSIGEDTVIHPFTVIEGHVTIGKNCEVGPFSHIREGTNLDDRAEIGNFVEVKASKIGKGVKAKHLTYLGDTIVGESTNIGAGTITANYDGKKKYCTQIEDGAFIGSGTILVAPVKVGRGAITGAGAVVTRGKDVAPGKTVVGVPARVLEKSNIKNQESK